MSSTVIVGAQWGDEGKGKIVDTICEKADLVVRYQGGNNAGHTVVTNGTKYKLHFLPSGAVHQKRCVLGAGVLIEPVSLLQEIENFEKTGLTLNLGIDLRCQVILPWHKELDGGAVGKNIGTTGKGIGPAYTDAYARTGVRLCDLLTEGLRAKLEKNLIGKNVTVNLDAAEKELSAQGKQLEKYMCDVSYEVNVALDANKNVVMEGAQATFLDVRFGTYPYVTSSHPIAGGACIGIGLSPKKIKRVEGVVKAYTTRVGNGAFPTELLDSTGEAIRTKGAEYGTTTGRPRRCGWLDLPMLRTAHQINDFDGFHITKLDVLSGLPVLKICTAYKINAVTSKYFPTTLDELESAIPEYIEMPGFGDVSCAQRYEDLPIEAKNYLSKIKELTNVPLLSVSVGADRKNIIWL